MGRQNECFTPSERPPADLLRTFLRKRTGHFFGQGERIRGRPEILQLSRQLKVGISCLPRNIISQSRWKPISRDQRVISTRDNFAKKGREKREQRENLSRTQGPHLFQKGKMDYGAYVGTLQMYRLSCHLRSIQAFNIRASMNHLPIERHER